MKVNQAAIACEALKNLQVGVEALVKGMTEEFQDATGGPSLLSSRYILKCIASVATDAIEDNKVSILLEAGRDLYEVHDLFTLAVHEKTRTSLDEKNLRLAHPDLIPLLEEYRKETRYKEVSVKAR